MATKTPGRMRVLHIVPAFFDANDGVLGGGERYALELARYMAEEVPTKLVTFGQKDRLERVGNLDVRVIGQPWKVRGQAGNPFSLAVLAELRKVEVVHCHQQHLLSSSFAALFCRLTRRKVFVSDLGGGGWDISTYISTDRWYHGHLHLSEYSRHISAQDNEPYSQVVLGGVDVEKFSPSSHDNASAPVVFVGRLLPHKGVDDLIKALPGDLKLELIGHAYDDRYLEALRKIGDGKQILFRHDCNDNELIEAYRRSLCVVLPSVYRTMYGEETIVPELLGQTLLEGMACGAPVICTRVASMPEIVQDGVTGFIVPPNDPSALAERICWLRDHPSEAQKMGRAGRQLALDKFTWPAVVRRCLAIYENTLRPNAARPR
jgi:glycosyltransferase involved in cell wall biosynthesis